MKHFIVGPVELYPFTKDIYNKDYFYFRTEEFGNMVKENMNRTSKLLNNNVENSLIYLTASGTAAMEAVIENCIANNDKALVINGGTFGKRFCELLKHHNAAYDSINLAWDEKLEWAHLLPYAQKGYTTLFVNLHETSTGQLYDIKILSDFCKENGMYLVVDAISTFLADDYDMEKYGIDVTIVSSQKGFCMSPGLSFISFSQRMKDKVLNNDFVKSQYFDFKDYFKNIERGQTPYTPAVFIMYELKAVLDYIDKIGGKDALLKIIEEKCIHFRKLAKENGLAFPEKYPLSNMLTPIICNDIKAGELVKHLRDKYELCVNPCGGALADKMFRVSHIGNTTVEDFDDLIEKIMLSINEIKNKEFAYDR
ncbi:MAG: aminotransferase class V-fold PLP-dependent enzyme [bacterium]|nr:aminotransferase class V-fold PLP-dependent enzyme [bacterium]